MRRSAIASLAASVLVLVGCATGPSTDATSTVPPSALPTSPTPSAPATAEADAEPEAPTCETLISPQLVSEFENLGWTAGQEAFMVGGTVIEGGLLCKWGDPSGSGEGLQIFGWAPITEAQADAGKRELLSSGWQAIDTDEGDFVTEDSDTAFATGEQGFGFTYQFGDGWVTFADTKQSLVLIQRPGA